MFNVTTVNLSSDTTIADVAFGSSVLGNLAEDEVIALLERFRRIDPLQNNESDPHLLIEANAGRFLIRTIAMVFDRHLREKQAQARYSRVI